MQQSAVAVAFSLLRGFSMDLSLAKCIAGRAVGASRALHCVHSPRVQLQLQLQFCLQFRSHSAAVSLCRLLLLNLLTWLRQFICQATKTSITHALSKNTVSKKIKCIKAALEKRPKIVRIAANIYETNCISWSQGAGIVVFEGCEKESTQAHAKWVT